MLFGLFKNFYMQNISISSLQNVRGDDFQKTSKMFFEFFLFFEKLLSFILV